MIVSVGLLAIGIFNLLSGQNWLTRVLGFGMMGFGFRLIACQIPMEPVTRSIVAVALLVWFGGVVAVSLAWLLRAHLQGSDDSVKRHVQLRG